MGLRKALILVNREPTPTDLEHGMTAEATLPLPMDTWRGFAGVRWSRRRRTARSWEVPSFRRATLFGRFTRINDEASASATVPRGGPGAAHCGGHDAPIPCPACDYGSDVSHEGEHEYALPRTRVLGANQFWHERCQLAWLRLSRLGAAPAAHERSVREPGHPRR